MLRRLILFLLALPLLLLPVLAPAQTPPDTRPAPLSDTVNDFAGLLSPEETARIADLLTAGRSETGVHVVLVTMGRIADHGGAGQRIEDYAKALFNDWGIGASDRNDGILILAAIEDREIRIALGSGYPVIWDNAAQRVIDREILPAFRENRYTAGLEAGASGVFDRIARPYTTGQDLPAEPTDWLGLGLFAVVGAFILFFLAMILRPLIGRLRNRLRPCPDCHRRGLIQTDEVLTAATTTAAGLGRHRIRCPSCGWHHQEDRSLPKQSAYRSPGGGGFGGGSSSGGGATGRW